MRLLLSPEKTVGRTNQPRLTPSGRLRSAGHHAHAFIQSPSGCNRARGRARPTSRPGPASSSGPTDRRAHSFRPCASRAPRPPSGARCGTSMRVRPPHTCPVLRNASSMPSTTARSKSASGRMMLADLPPSSRCMRLIVADADLHHAAAGAHRARQRHHVDQGMRGDRLADLGPGAADQVEDAGRQAGFGAHLGKHERGQRCDLGGLAARRCIPPPSPRLPSRSRSAAARSRP